MLSGMEQQPISGPDSIYDVDNVLHGRTAHDVRMREAVTKTGWPLVQSFAAAPLEAGSVVLHSHNTFHRRDDWRTWPDNPRFMWRFWLYRVSDMPAASDETASKISWRNLGVEPLTGVDLSGVSDDLSEDECEELAEELAEQLCAKYDEAEPQRVGAAYRLAALGDSELAVQHLSTGLYHHRESARRAATYGLIAVGEDATETLLIAAESPMKWVRKNAVYALGDASHLTEEVLRIVRTRLDADPSVYIRSVAAGSLGCLGRRAIATGEGKDLVPACAHALLNSLAHEENRLGMSAAQGRSIKFVRPTDDCDVCEGDGVDFGLERFAPVRSAVRENALWSMVMLCSHGSAVLGRCGRANGDSPKGDHRARGECDLRRLCDGCAGAAGTDAARGRGCAAGDCGSAR